MPLTKRGGEVRCSVVVFRYGKKNAYTPDDVCFYCVDMVREPAIICIATNTISKLELGGSINHTSSENGTKEFLLPHYPKPKHFFSQQSCAFTHKDDGSSTIPDHSSRIGFKAA